MTERRFTLDDEENGLCRCILVDGEEMPTCEICELLNEEEAIIQRLKLENENLRKQVKSFETTMNATSDYNAFLESKITTLEKENRELNSIKKFSEKNGINIFLIDEAFRNVGKIMENYLKRMSN